MLWKWTCEFEFEDRMIITIVNVQDALVIIKHRMNFNCGTENLLLIYYYNYNYGKLILWSFTRK